MMRNSRVFAMVANNLARIDEMRKMAVIEALRFWNNTILKLQTFGFSILVIENARLAGCAYRSARWRDAPPMRPSLREMWTAYGTLLPAPSRETFYQPGPSPLGAYEVFW